MSIVAGGAWIAPGVAETLRSARRLEGFATLAELKTLVAGADWVPAGDLEDFRRGCEAVRLAQLAALLAAADAGEAWRPERAAALVFAPGAGPECPDCASLEQLFEEMRYRKWK